jgi:hypothetical protein
MVKNVSEDESMRVALLQLEHILNSRDVSTNRTSSCEIN